MNYNDCRIKYTLSFSISTVIIEINNMLYFMESGNNAIKTWFTINSHRDLETVKINLLTIKNLKLWIGRQFDSAVVLERLAIIYWYRSSSPAQSAQPSGVCVRLMWNTTSPSHCSLIHAYSMAAYMYNNCINNCFCIGIRITRR